MSDLYSFHYILLYSRIDNIHLVTYYHVFFEFVYVQGFQREKHCKVR